ncbi:IPT/TIG domain-containing protein [Streptomyces sp. 6N223]|uniref:IPT/TIG domain-containing protein n=1 Tax=Streptomyces sp. 6N223 TaxID=3457412 RepID=UPI003FD4C392
MWYYYILPPYKTAVTPASGPLSGGTTVISGTHFSTATSVSFGANSAVPTVVNDSTLNVNVPTATVSGSVPVRVTTIGGTTNGLTYTYVAPPVVTSMSPTSGPDYGGTASTITGTGLSDVIDVLYGTEPGVFLINDDTEIISSSPEGTGTVTVTVVGLGGSDATQTFTYAVTPG